MKYREKKQAIIWLILAIAVFAWFWLTIVKYIYPSVLDIEDRKVSLSEKLDRYSVLNKKWFNFVEFKLLNSVYWWKQTDPSTWEDIYVDEELYESINSQFYKSVYKMVDKSFYEGAIYDWWYEGFENNNSSFIDHLDDIDKRLLEVKNSEKFNKRKWNLSLVLPKYSSYVELDSKEWLTDLEFVNSLEILLKKFNLKTKSVIWAKSIIPATSDVINSDDDIYYIPLDLELVWTKIWIIDFLRYVKNSWAVEFVENDFDFSNENGEISQLAEIDTFSISDYIDSSSEKRSTQDYSLKNFLLKSWQSNDIIQVNVKINFYISGISSEKIINEINGIIGKNFTKIKLDKYWNFEKDEKTGEYKQELLHYNYTNISKVVKKLNSNPTLQKNAYYSKKVNNMLIYLDNNDLKKDIASLQKDLKKQENLNSIYLKALKYKDIFLKIDKEAFIIVKSLWIDKQKIYSKNYIFE